MDYNEVLQRARARMAPRCKVCPECNGLGCGNTMPGPGSKAPGNGANDNWRAWRRWCLNMDTIDPNTPVDTSLELLGRTFSLPVIAAPIGSLRAQFHPEDDIRDYNACCIAAAAQTGIAASFGDGLDARVFPHGCAPYADRRTGKKSSSCEAFASQLLCGYADKSAAPERLAVTGAGCTGCGHSAAAKWARRPAASRSRTGRHRHRRRFPQ